ncbi:hypothetical protein JVU11DRAFT_54 [Chiua virens]|nr:hypothetical protein JVU11DRAFT_54 [Chiua virens]
MSDPVASKSTFLCMYMTNHPDTLVAYVKHFGKIPGNVSSAAMKSIDSKGMNLSYSLKSGGVGSVHVKFSPPLSGYDEVKPRLLAMKADAQEALGMLRSPKITSFRLPRSAILVLLSMAYLGLAPPQGTSVPFIPTNITDMVFMPVRTAFSMFDLQPSMKTIVQITGVAHSLETLYTWYLCRHYVKGPFITAAYLSATLVCGFPIWIDLQKRIQEMRIESVMKVE